MKTLEGQTIFAYMTDIDDKYIEEAAYPMTAIQSVPQKISFGSKLSHAINHPVGVAVICGIVSLGVLAGIIWAGQNPPSGTPVTPPVGGTSDATEANPEDSLDILLPDTANAETSAATEAETEIETETEATTETETEIETETEAMTEAEAETESQTEADTQASAPILDSSPNFDFSFSIDDGGVLKRGQTYNIRTTITNTGEAFTYSGSSTDFFAEAILIYHSGHAYDGSGDADPYEIQGMFPMADDYMENIIVSTGQSRILTGVFHIPADAPIGQYDLNLSYKGEYTVYENAVSIYSEERFAFAHEGIDPFPDGNVYNVGGYVTITASVTNLGESFKVYEDYYDSFVPTVKFVCRNTGYVIHASTPKSDDIGTFIVGELETGKAIYFADIPEDADAGIYDLVLSYSDESRTFYEVIQIVRVEIGEGETNQDPQPDYNPAPVSTEDEAIQAVLKYLTTQDAAYPLWLHDLQASATYMERQSAYRVTLQHHIASIPTDYCIRATITNDGHVFEVEETSWNKDSYFLQYTDKDVRAAVERLCFNNDIGSAAYYFEFIDGKLYVCCEVIVSLTPPPAVTDEEGNEYVDGGCGIDHDHVFYKEEVRHEG